MAKQRSIHWEATQRRLQENLNALGEGSTNSDFVERTLKQRTRLLARPVQTNEISRQAPVIVCGIGTTRFGLETTRLAEVLPLKGCTPVPWAKPELAGVVNRRGQICPLVDLGRMLGADPDLSPALGFGIFLRQRKAGLKVERMEGMRHVELKGLQALPDATAGGLRFVKGLGPDLLVIIDMEAVLSHPIFEELE